MSSGRRRPRPKKIPAERLPASVPICTDGFPIKPALNAATEDAKIPRKRRNPARSSDPKGPRNMADMAAEHSAYEHKSEPTTLARYFPGNADLFAVKVPTNMQEAPSDANMKKVP
eukprot:263781_1